MSTSTIDGTIEQVVLGRSARGMQVFKAIHFRRNDGEEKILKKAVTTTDVAQELVPGAKGRFYMFKAFDIGGVHGVRTADGRAVYGFPGNNQKIFLIVGIVSVLWIAVRLFLIGDGIPLLSVGLLILSIVGYILMGKGRTEAQVQFDADG